MRNLQWEDLGEWLEPPRTDGRPRAFRYHDVPAMKHRRVFIVPGSPPVWLGTPGDHSENSQPC